MCPMNHAIALYQNAIKHLNWKNHDSQTIEIVTSLNNPVPQHVVLQKFNEFYGGEFSKYLLTAAGGRYINGSSDVIEFFIFKRVN